MGAMSESAGLLPLLALMVVGHLNSVALGPLSRKVSQTWLRRLKALTAAKLKLVLLAGMVCTT